MPLLKRNELQIDYSDQGSGAPVILIHSSVSGNRQWRSLIEHLKDRYRLLAINLYGYGLTSPWNDAVPQTLADQASLVLELGSLSGYPVHLVGHSFGGAVALKVAALLPQQISGLVLVEPNPFFLLDREGSRELFQEMKALCDAATMRGAMGDWDEVGALFLDYWSGSGAWKEMPASRKTAFLKLLPNTLQEWDGVLQGSLTLESWEASSAKTLVLTAVDVRRPIRELVRLLAQRYPHWSFAQIPQGGHMAPLTRPDLVNPMIARFLDSFG